MKVPAKSGYYFNNKGYYRVPGHTIYPDKFYILSFKDLRKPVLLRLACDNRFLAKRYILLNTRAEHFEVIKGEYAIERNIQLSNRVLIRSQLPTRHAYPKGLSKKKKKQYRTGFRKRLRKFFSSSNSLKQFVVHHSNKTYCVYDFTTMSAFNQVNKVTNISWNLFIKKVSNKPQKLQKNWVFIKPQHITLIIINQFNKTHKLNGTKYHPTYGKVSRLEGIYISLQKQKPKQLLF